MEREVKEEEMPEKREGNMRGSIVCSLQTGSGGWRRKKNENHARSMIMLDIWADKIYGHAMFWHSLQGVDPENMSKKDKDEKEKEEEEENEEEQKDEEGYEEEQKEEEKEEED